MQSSPGNPAFELPSVLYPPNSVCYTIKIPNDPGYIKAFLGALYDTTLWISWQRDAGHNGILAAQVMKAIWNDLEQQSCTINPVDQVGIGTDIGDVMIRQDPDNPCLLQSSVDGTNWCTFADLSKCTPASSQPGPGSAQPAPGGGQACYSFQMNGNSFAYLPFGISTGDVLTIMNPTGAISSSHNDLWLCEDGGQFFLGKNVGFPQTFSGDPVPTSPTGGLIVVVNGVNYYIGAGSWTVPAGVSNAPALIQANDASITGLSGSYQFQVCVTNNQAVQFTHHWDVTINPGPWSPYNNGVSNATWTPGTGFTVSNSGGPTGEGVLSVGLSNALPLAHCTLKYAYTTINGDPSAGLYNWPHGSLFGPSPTQFIQNSPPAAGSFQGMFSATAYDVAVDMTQDNPGSAVITDIWITADGTDPF